jgi:alpha-L-rhamnosidase
MVCILAGNVFAQTQNETSITGLTVNYQVNPLGIDKNKIRFGWQMTSTRIGQSQSAYQIVIRTGTPDGVIIWDSKSVTSGLSTGIQYVGSALAYETKYYWTVTVTPTFGASITSKPAYFMTGTTFSGATWIMPVKSLQTDADPLTAAHKQAGNTWNLPLINPADDPNGNQLVKDALIELFGFAPSTTGWERTAAATGTPTVGNFTNYVRLGGNPLLRTEVTLNRNDIVSAVLYMTGMGNYEAYVNGKKAPIKDPKGVNVEPMFAPGASDYKLFTNYQTYDVTDLVKANKGRVVLAAEMHKGYYAGRVSQSHFNPVADFTDSGKPWQLPGSTDISRTMALLGKMIITFADGSTQVVGTNPSGWKSIAGPVIFNDYYMGEFFCANKARELNGWNNVGFDDRGWFTVTDRGRNPGNGNPEITFASAFEAAGATLEPNNSAIAQFHDSPEWNFYPTDVFKFKPEQIVRPTETQFLSSIEARETGNLLEPNGVEFFTINQRGKINKIPVNFANTKGVFTTPVTLSYGEVLSVHFGQNLSGTVRMSIEGQQNTVVKIRHAEMLNDNVARRGINGGIAVNGGPDAPEFSLYYGAMRGWDGQTSYYKMVQGRQTWRPHTLYNGFEHAEISVETPGSTITIYSLESLNITSVHNRTGEITTNNRWINRMIENGFWGQASNWTTIPTDCNQRTERAGWTGDAQVIANAAMFNFDAIPFYDAYMEMMARHGEAYDYRYGSVMPAGFGSSNLTQTASGWADAGIVIPWQAYMKTGDTHIITRNWQAMDGFMDKIYGNGPNGDNGTFMLSVKPGSGTASDENVRTRPTANIPVRSQHTYTQNNYGDWLAFKGANLQYVSAVYQIYSSILMRDMATAIGNAAAVVKYQTRYDELKANFLKPPVLMEAEVTATNRYGIQRVDGGFVYDVKTAAWVTEILNRADRPNVSPLEAKRISGDLMSGGGRQGTIDDLMDNAQTALTWAIKLGLYRDEAHRQHMIDALLINIRNTGKQIRNEPEYSLGVGFLGVNVLLPVTTNVGGQEIAYKAIYQDRVPGWMAPVRNLGTTWWERWNSFDVTFGFGPAGMNSFNHFAYGCINEWFYEYMLGIQPVPANPGFKEIILQPTIDTSDHTDIDNFELEIERIVQASGHYDSQYGRIESGWNTCTTCPEGIKLNSYQTRIPANTSATLYLPVAAITGVRKVTTAPGTVYKGETVYNGVQTAKFELASGGYFFEINAAGAITVRLLDGYIGL